MLRYSISIGQENPEAESGRLDLVRKYLAARMQMPVVVIGSTGYGVTIEAFRAKKIEAGTLGPFSYVIGSERAGIEAIATRGTPGGQLGQYSGTLSVVANSPLHTVDDLVRHAHELTISFVDPASTSGNLVQRAYFKSVGIEPEKDFKKVVYTTAHVTSAMTLVAGKVDVAAVSQSALDGLIFAGKLRRDEVRSLWLSPPIPESPVAVRKDLPQSFKSKLQQVLLDMASAAPDAYRNMTAKVYFERYRNTRWLAATDATYQPLRVLAQGAAGLGFLEH